MRFSVAAAAILATAVSAGSTVYVTEEVTITGCATTVTDCPASSTYVSLTSYVQTTTTPAAPVYTAPAYHNSSAPYVHMPETHLPETHVPETHLPETHPVPTEHLSTLTISTCIPTVIYSTITVVPTTTAAPPTYTAPSNATVPAATASVYPTKPVDFTGAASSVQMSAFAAALGLAAFVLA